MKDSLRLRHTITPYMLVPVILILIVLVSFPYMAKTGDLSPFIIFIIGLLFFSPIPIMGMFYCIWLQESKIIMRAGNGSLTSIEIDEIEKIKQETSDAATFISLRRPVRRISIYGKTSEGIKLIDISLKHFRLDDIRKLMKVIHEIRQDLELPEQWLN